MAKEGQNPCVFKKVCSECTKVSLENRPFMCEAMGCPDFRLCPGCNLNKTLHPYLDKNLCKKCIQNQPAVRKAADSRVKQEVREELSAISKGIHAKKFANEPSSGKTEEDQQADAVAAFLKGATGSSAKTVMQIPGIPPDILPQDEKDYYNKRYQEYKDYYRNPSSFFLCHQIILVEMFINNINDRLVRARGEANFSLLQEQAQAAKILTDYKKMLPDAESEQMSDHERAMGMIHEAYIREKGLRAPINGVSRVLTSAAVALNPVLKFPLNLPAVLKNLGFNLIEIEELTEQIGEHYELTGRTKEEIAEFFGFRIRKEYAIDEDDAATAAIMEEELDAYKDDDDDNGK